MIRQAPALLVTRFYNRFALLALVTCYAAGASATPPIQIWLSDGVGRFGNFYFNVLGGKSSHPTPAGAFHVQSKHEKFYSAKYRAPMPLSLFFTDQCAIHVGSLRVKSHGCVHVDWPIGQHLFNHARPGVTRVYVYP